MNAKLYWDAEREAVKRLKEEGHVDPRDTSIHWDYDEIKRYDTLLASKRLLCIKETYSTNSLKSNVPSKPQRWDGYQ